MSEIEVKNVKQYDHVTNKGTVAALCRELRKSHILISELIGHGPPIECPACNNEPEPHQAGCVYERAVKFLLGEQVTDLFGLSAAIAN